MKTVAIIYEDSNYGTGIAEYIKSRIDETGLEIVGMMPYSAKASTLSAEVTKLVSLDPDILIPVGYYSDQNMLAKELIDRKQLAKEEISSLLDSISFFDDEY